MAIGNPVNRGTRVTTFAAGSSTASITPASTISAGSLLVVGFTTFTAAARTVSSVTDTQSNTYTVDAQVQNGTVVLVAICRSILTTSLTTSDTVTLTLSAANAGNPYRADLEEVTGIVATAPLDVSQTATGSGTALTTGTTTATSQASEIGIAYWGIQAAEAADTAGAGYTALGIVSGPSNALLGEYQILSATGTQAATLTAGTTGSWAGAQVTYKASLASAPFAAKPNFIYLRKNT